MPNRRRSEINGKVQCVSCKKWKVLSEFHTRKESGRPYSKCKGCHNAQSALRQKLKPPSKEQRSKWARKSYATKWYAKDVYASRQDAKEHGAESTLTPEEWKAVVEDYDYCCHLCGKRLTVESSKDNTITLEHKTPLSRGGKNERDNVAPACFVCNSAKRNMTLEEFKALAREWAK